MYKSISQFVIPFALCAACGGAPGGVDENIGHFGAALSASSRPGMGAIPYAGGVTFRVWAPGVSRVFVAGDWNGFSDSANELGNEFNGNFSADVSGASRWQKYKFVFVTSWGAKLWRVDPHAYRVENSVGDGVIHDPGAYSWKNSFGAPSWNELVLYEMHVGTFNDSPGFGPGNWRSAKDKLGHLKNLGINAVEIMPVAEFAGDFSWGYNPAFPFAPENAYGTPEDMKEFIDAAHGHGIAVIVDIVHNHWGPSDLPMWCITGDCLSKGGHYFYTDWRADTPWSSTRPDYGRGEVRDYIKDAAMYWLQEYHADGLRWDGTKFMHTTDGTNALRDGWTLLQYTNNGIDATQPWKLSIAEDFGPGDPVTRGTGAGGAGFDSQWDGSFVHPVRGAVMVPNDGSRDMNKVRDAITHKFNGQATQRVIYSESHDEVANGQERLPSAIDHGSPGSWYARKRSTLAAAIALTSPGIPMLFEGQEFLENGYFRDDVPLDWSKASTYSGILKMYTDLVRLRRNWNNNTRGLRGDEVNVFHVNNTDKLIAYHRWQAGGGGDDVVVAANFSTTPRYDYQIGMPRGGTWYVRFNSDWNGYSSDFANTRSLDVSASGAGRDGMGQSASINIGAYSVVIFSQ